MTFEEALRSELINITVLSKKVYPLVAPKEVNTPYLVYRRGLTDFEKTLGGISKDKVDSAYELVLVTDNYSDVQNISALVVEKLITFLDRSIGTSGLKVRNISIKIIGDTYEPSIDKYRCDLEINVSY